MWKKPKTWPPEHLLMVKKCSYFLLAATRIEKKWWKSNFPHSDTTIYYKKRKKRKIVAYSRKKEKEIHLWKNKFILVIFRIYQQKLRSCHAKNYQQNQDFYTKSAPQKSVRKMTANAIFWPLWKNKKKTTCFRDSFWFYERQS